MQWIFPEENSRGSELPDPGLSSANRKIWKRPSNFVISSGNYTLGRLCRHFRAWNPLRSIMGSINHPRSNLIVSLELSLRGSES